MASFLLLYQQCGGILLTITRTGLQPAHVFHDARLVLVARGMDFSCIKRKKRTDRTRRLSYYRKIAPCDGPWATAVLTSSISSAKTIKEPARPDPKYFCNVVVPQHETKKRIDQALREGGGLIPFG